MLTENEAGFFFSAFATFLEEHGFALDREACLKRARESAREGETESFQGKDYSFASIPNYYSIDFHYDRPQEKLWITKEYEPKEGQDVPL